MALLRELYRGDDSIWAFQLLVETTTPEGSAPLSLPSGAVFILTAKIDPLDDTDGNAIFQKHSNISGQGSVVSAPLGKLEFNIDRSDTQNVEPGLYVYDLKQVYLGSITTLTHGQLMLLANVTRSSS